MRYIIHLALLTRLLVSCNALPQSSLENDEASRVDSAIDRPGNQGSSAWEPSVVSPGNAEDSKPGLKAQTLDTSGDFADRAEVVAALTYLEDRPSDNSYAEQRFYVVVDEYKGESLVRRSSCETRAVGVYETKSVTMSPLECYRLDHRRPLPDEADKLDLFWSYYNFLHSNRASYVGDEPFKMNLSTERIPNFPVTVTFESNGVTSSQIKLEASAWTFLVERVDRNLIEGLWRLPSGEGVAIEPYRAKGILDWESLSDD